MIIAEDSNRLTAGKQGAHRNAGIGGIIADWQEILPEIENR